MARIASWWIAAETAGELSFPFIPGRGLGHLDDALRWVDEFGLDVILDRHAAVGSQNGKQTSWS